MTSETGIFGNSPEAAESGTTDGAVAGTGVIWPGGERDAPEVTAGAAVGSGTDAIVVCEGATDLEGSDPEVVDPIREV